MAWRDAARAWVCGGRWPRQKCVCPLGSQWMATRGPKRPESGWVDGWMASSSVPASWPAPNGFEPYLPRTDDFKPADSVKTLSSHHGVLASCDWLPRDSLKLSLAGQHTPSSLALCHEAPLKPVYIPPSRSAPYHHASNMLSNGHTPLEETVIGYPDPTLQASICSLMLKQARGFTTPPVVVSRPPVCASSTCQSSDSWVASAPATSACSIPSSSHCWHWKSPLGLTLRHHNCRRNGDKSGLEKASRCGLQDQAGCCLLGLIKLSRLNRP